MKVLKPFFCTVKRERFMEGDNYSGNTERIEHLVKHGYLQGEEKQKDPVVENKNGAPKKRKTKRK